MLATTGDDGAVRVWDPTTGEELLEFKSTTAEKLGAPSFSPDGSRLAASLLNRHLVRVIDLTTGDTIADVESVGDVRTLRSARTARGLALANDGPTARVVDAESGALLFTIGGNEGWIRDVGVESGRPLDRQQWERRHSPHLELRHGRAPIHRGRAHI